VSGVSACQPRETGEAIHLQLLRATIAGGVNGQVAQVIRYLIEENRVLKEQLAARGRSWRLTDDRRRRPPAKGKPLGHKLLSEVAGIVTPDTIMAWYHRLIASNWECPRAKVGRPGMMKEIRTLIVRMAEENDEKNVELHVSRVGDAAESGER